MDIITHYDSLIDENNDSFRDPPSLQGYMDKWDGKVFIDALCLDGTQKVLEIGIGTGRLAARTAPMCMALTGIDISPKTVERAKENLRELCNISYICDDFLKHPFTEGFDVIYCSLVSMHFEDKDAFILKASELLEADGVFCISLDKNQSNYIDMGTRRLRIYPDTSENIIKLAGIHGLYVRAHHETEFADILLFSKGDQK